MQIPVSKHLAVFLTSDTLASGGVSRDLSSRFRQVTLIKPDTGLILKGKCSAFGFKAPAVLALRLKLVSDAVKDIL